MGTRGRERISRCIGAPEIGDGSHLRGPTSNSARAGVGAGFASLLALMVFLGGCERTAQTVTEGAAADGAGHPSGDMAIDAEPPLVGDARAMGDGPMSSDAATDAGTAPDGGAVIDAGPRPPDRGVVQGECSNASVYERLRPTCEGCHAFGTFPAFASLGSYERLIAYDPSWVIPGDPEQSALLDLLRGEASGSIRAMPPGQNNFADLEAQDRTLITIDDLSECIRQMGAPTMPQASDAVVARLKTAEQIRQALYDQLRLVYSDFVSVNYMHLDQFFISDPDEVPKLTAYP